jgi:hypothetical protein
VKEATRLPGTPARSFRRLRRGVLQAVIEDSKAQDAFDPSFFNPLN